MGEALIKPSSEDASRRMRATGQRDTRPELLLRSALHRRGLRFRVHYRPLPDFRRRADIVFTRARVAVFVDGCYWHGCPQHMTWPTANGDWWREKIDTNCRRDRDTDHHLSDRGWNVVRIWEHTPVEEAVRLVLAALPMNV